MSWLNLWNFKMWLSEMLLFPSYLQLQQTDSHGDYVSLFALRKSQIISFLGQKLSNESQKSLHTEDTNSVLQAEVSQKSFLTKVLGMIQAELRCIT